MNNTFDFEAFKAQAIEQLKAGVPLSVKHRVSIFLMQFVDIFPLFQKSAFSLYGLEK